MELLQSLNRDKTIVLQIDTQLKQTTIIVTNRHKIKRI